MMQLVYKLFCLTITVALQLLGKRTNYDELTARKLFNMAAGAYGKQQEKCLNRTFPTYETYDVVHFMEEKCDDLENLCGSYAAASETAKQLIIVFRGTISTSQLLWEALESTKPGEYFLDMGDVNRYFLNGHRAMWPLLEHVLKNSTYAGYKFIFTGHSLGGALAVLAAARTVKEGYRPGNEITIYTFGEPRVGDVTFAENFDQMIPDSYRVVFRRDLVPHLPACSKNRSWAGDDEASRPCDRDKLHRWYHHSTEICQFEIITNSTDPSRQFIPLFVPAKTQGHLPKSSKVYPSSMEPESEYIECVGEPKGEDLNCSDTINFRLNEYSSYIWDHQHYFTVWVYQYGESGCNITVPEPKPGLFGKLTCLISPNPDCEEDLTTSDDRIEVVPLEYLNALPSTTTEDTITKRSSSLGDFLPLVFCTLGSLLRGKLC